VFKANTPWRSPTPVRTKLEYLSSRNDRWTSAGGQVELRFVLRPTQPEGANRPFWVAIAATLPDEGSQGANAARASVRHERIVGNKLHPAGMRRCLSCPQELVFRSSFTWNKGLEILVRRSILRRGKVDS
jgi:hypothetical protein